MCKNKKWTIISGTRKAEAAEIQLGTMSLVPTTLLLTLSFCCFIVHCLQTSECSLSLEFRNSKFSTCGLCVTSQGVNFVKPFTTAEILVKNTLHTQHTVWTVRLVEQYCENEKGTRPSLAVWLSGRTSVSDRRTFPGLPLTCSWWITIYMGKPSAVGQLTRPTQPFILSESINE